MSARPYTAKDEKILMTELWDPQIADDPYRFVKFIFPWGKVNTPLEHYPGPRAWQCEVLQLVTEHVRKQKARIAAGQIPEVLQVAISSGRGIGKSALEVWLGYWMLSTRLGSTVIVSANSDDQLRKVTWGELAIWHALALNSHWFDLQATALTPADWFSKALHNQLKKGGPYYQMVQKLWNAENPNSYAGPHNKDGLMLLFDEASGIPEPIWDVATGYHTEPVLDRYWFAFSNPRENTSAFYKCFHANRDFWITRNIDARTVEGTDPNRYAQIIKQHGPDSDQARVEVYGQFPRQGDKQFISRETIDAAVERELQKDDHAPLIMGVDVARFGDDSTVICFRQGRDGRSIPAIKLKGADNMEVVGAITQWIQKANPDAICIDAGNGTGVIDRLRELGYKVHEVWFGSKAEEPEWANKRTEIWARMREWLNGGCLPNDKELIEDLAGPNYKFQGSSDKIMLESKEEMKKRGQHSPDYADALACTFAVRVARRDLRSSRLSPGNRARVARDVDYSIFG